MALLLPNLRQVLKYASGIKDGATRAAVSALEGWADELTRRLARLEETTGGSGVVSSVTGTGPVLATPTTGAVVVDVDESLLSGIPQSAVTGLVAALAALPTGSGTAGRSTRWSAGTVLANGAFTDDGTNATLGGTLTLSPITAGSVLFGGTAGLVSQDNVKLFWDDTNNRLGIGNAAPATALHVTGTARATAGLTVDTMTSGSVWFAGASGALTQDNARFRYDNTTKTLKLDGTGSNFVFDINGADTSGSGDTVRIRNDSGGFGLATLRFDNNSTQVGTLIGYNAAGFGLVNGMTMAVPGTKTFGIRQGGSTTIANFDATNTYIFSRLSVGHQGNPAVPLDVRGSISGSPAFRLQNTSASGYSATMFVDNGGTEKGDVGYGNASVAVAHLQSKNYLWSTGPDWVIANATKAEFTLGMTDGSTFLEAANGSSAAVSAANTGRLRYNTTGQKFQVSANAAAYADLVTSAAAVGVANTVPKWTAANAQGVSLVTDDATTLAYNTNKFTVASATGNTACAGTLAVSGTAAVIRSGTGSPEAVVTAPVGSLFLRTDGGAGTTLYVKESGVGNTGWIGK